MALIWTFKPVEICVSLGKVKYKFYIYLITDSCYQTVTTAEEDSNHNSSSDEVSKEPEKGAQTSNSKSQAVTTKTTSKTRISIPNSAEPLSPEQAPIIVLQEAPVIIQPNQEGDDHLEVTRTEALTIHDVAINYRHKTREISQDMAPLYQSQLHKVDEINAQDSPLLSAVEMAHNGPHIGPERHI